MTNNGVIEIHGKSYMTVARRVELALEDGKLEKVETEVLSHNPVVIKATVIVKGRTFTGISAVVPSTARAIEKQNPYEVAETSAVGRALGFAGYGITEGIASADEMAKAGVSEMTNENHPELNDEPPMPEEDEVGGWCKTHSTSMAKGYSKTKRDANNNPKPYWYHKQDTQMCFGSGFKG